MKMMHKPTLSRERAIRYDTAGQYEIIHNLEKVYLEIEIWTQLSHCYITKLYEMIDDDKHDYLYLILEMADLGQLAKWDFKLERYIPNQEIYHTVLNHLAEHAGVKIPNPEDS